MYPLYHEVWLPREKYLQVTQHWAISLIVLNCEQIKLDIRSHFTYSMSAECIAFYSDCTLAKNLKTM